MHASMPARRTHPAAGTLPARRGGWPVHAKIVLLPSTKRCLAARRGRDDAPAKDPTMDIERINAIGSMLADLSERTSALRGYL